jgi:GNAT superfamily N-acetyltransferase
MIIGFALYYFGYSTWKGRTLYLEDLYVQEDFRKAGIGQQLFDHIVSVAKNEKVRRMDWQVLNWNEPALAFYRKNKAILDDEWINGRLFF